MTISLEKAYAELAAALAAPDDDIFYDIVAISDRLLKGGHADAELEAWATTAAQGILARDLPIGSLTSYDTLDPRFSALTFQLMDTELVTLWPQRSVENLLSLGVGEAHVDWNEMPDCQWRRLRQVLVFEGPAIENGFISWLARQQLPALRRFKARNVGLSSEAFVVLTNASFWRRLVEVDVGYNPIGAGAPWPDMPMLRVLRIPKTSTTNDTLALLARSSLRGVVEFDISGNPIDHVGLDLIARRSLPALETLSARGCRFADGHAWRSVRNASWPALRDLDLQDSLRDPSPLTDAPILPQLERLDLASTELNDAGASVLSTVHLDRLQSLSVSYNELTDAGAVALSRARLPALKTFHASVNPLGDRGVSALTSAAWWRTLETVGLVNVELTEEGLLNLASNLPSTLRELFVKTAKPLSPRVLAALQQALPQAATLR